MDNAEHLTERDSIGVQEKLLTVEIAKRVDPMKKMSVTQKNTCRRLPPVMVQGSLLPRKDRK